MIQAFRNSEGHETGKNVQCYGYGDCSTQTECGKQDKSREQCADDGARRVDPIELTDTCAKFVGISGDNAGQDRKCATHQKSGNEEYGDRAEESEREQKRRQIGGVWIEPDVKPTHSAESYEREDSGGSDQQFDIGVKRDGFCVASPATNVRAPSRETGHKYGEHRCNRKERMAKDQAQGLDPRDLIDQPRHAGEKETGKKGEVFGLSSVSCFQVAIRL